MDFPTYQGMRFPRLNRVMCRYTESGTIGLVKTNSIIGTNPTPLSVPLEPMGLFWSDRSGSDDGYIVEPLRLIP